MVFTLKSKATIKRTILENRANKADFLENSTLNRNITLNNGNWEPVRKSSLPPMNGLLRRTSAAGLYEAALGNQAIGCPR